MNVLILLLALAGPTQALEIRTNAAVFSNVPPGMSWLTQRRIEKIVDRVERSLEWDIRRVRVYWYTDAAEFARAHGLGTPSTSPNSGSAGSILAVARRTDSSIHIGPKVTESNFDATFAHELTHVVLFQKYKSAIPSWLDEGLANYVGKKGGVDYLLLKTRGVGDIKRLTHPFAEGSDVSYHYMLSTAAIEMLAKKCNLEDLLQLSVGAKLEPYIARTCGIGDLNAELARWVDSQSSRAGTAR